MFYVNEMVTQRFCKACSVPYACIIELVKYTEWAAGIVPVMKSDETLVQICGDFKLTIIKNQ